MWTRQMCPVLLVGISVVSGQLFLSVKELPTEVLTAKFVIMSCLLVMEQFGECQDDAAFGALVCLHVNQCLMVPCDIHSGLLVDCL